MPSQVVLATNQPSNPLAFDELPVESLRPDARKPPLSARNRASTARKYTTRCWNPAQLRAFFWRLCVLFM
jgi:hypothetical protein